MAPFGVPPAMLNANSLECPPGRVSLGFRIAKVLRGWGTRLEGGEEVPHISKNGVNMHRFDINLSQMYWKIYIWVFMSIWDDMIFWVSSPFFDCGAHRKVLENQQRIIFGPSNSLLGIFFPLLGMWPLLFRCPFLSLVAYWLCLEAHITFVNMLVLFIIIQQELPPVMAGQPTTS